MKIINIGGMVLNLEVVRAATSEPFISVCIAHPAMLCAWEMVAYGAKEAIQEVYSDPIKWESGPSTIGGVAVVVDPNSPIDAIEFKNNTGEVVSKIESIAIPVGFERKTA